jgi:hypothetical protein
MRGIRSTFTLTPNGESRLEVEYPSGAKEITVKGPGYCWSHLALPYHEGSIYDLINHAKGGGPPEIPWASPRDVTDWTPDPTAGDDSA